MSFPITRAKLCPPALPAEHVPRPHLLAKLQAGREKKLTLVIAGAGYGKTTLLAEWVKGNEQAVWYSLDAVDRDPAVFFAYLLAGLRERWPEFGLSIEATLNRPVPPDPERLTLALIGETEGRLNSQSLLIVFDDYHRLEDAPAIDTVMSFLLERLPTGVHIALSSRAPVKFPTARLRAAGQLNELTHLDLRFNTDETGRLFLALDSMPGIVQQFVNRAEGWVAGLQLIRQILAQQGYLDLETFFKNPRGPLDHIYASFVVRLWQPKDTNVSGGDLWGRIEHIQSGWPAWTT
jgi:LuxR family maltose regulon positive regulatory protein